MSEIEIINNSNAVKGAAGIRFDPGITEITPEQLEACKETAAWDEWVDEEQIEVRKGNQYATSGSAKKEKRTEKFTVDDIPMHDFEAKEQDKKRQEIFSEKYKNEEWVKRQILGCKADGMSKTEALEHIAKWCGVSATTIRRYAP